MTVQIGINQITGMTVMNAGTDYPALRIDNGRDFIFLHMPAHICAAVAKAFTDATAEAAELDAAIHPLPIVIGDDVQPLHGRQV